MNTSKNGEQPIGAPFHVDTMTAEERITLGRNIGQWRTERNMTALELSQAAGVDRKTLRTIESGSRAGQVSKLKAILEALNIAQDGDYDQFSDRTQAFIYSAAPIFDMLPADVQDEAQHDVVVLLAGKLSRLSTAGASNVSGRDDDVEEMSEYREDYGRAARGRSKDRGYDVDYHDHDD